MCYQEKKSTVKSDSCIIDQENSKYMRRNKYWEIKKGFFARLECVLSQIMQNLKIRKEPFFVIFIALTFSLTLY